MTEPPLHLIIGNYNTSSSSLRAWLVLRLAQLAFLETRIPLRRPETPGRIAQMSPSGKLPVLLAETVPIWDSMAIAEFVAELDPGLWPLDPIARAEARAISAEVHSGFIEFRRLMPMDLVNRFSSPGRLPAGLAADVDRIKAIWEQCRARFAAEGPFLFGAFSIADCMMAPIAIGFVTHGVPLDGVVEDYVESVMSWPDMEVWRDAAAAEQAERELHGTLGMVTTSRPGRLPGAAATDATAAVATTARPDAAVAETVPPPEQPSAVETPRVAEPERAVETAGTQKINHGAADEAVAARLSPADVAASARPVADGSPAAASGSEPEPPPASRDRSPDPIAEPEDTIRPSVGLRRRALAAGGRALPRIDQVAANGTGRPMPGEPNDPAAQADTGGRRADLPKLGWIRRPVSIGQLDDAAGQDDNKAATPRPHQTAEARRGSSPAVKPIGGGILRRR